MKIIENQRKSTKINENQRKSKKISENQRKSTKINENQRKSTNISENQRKSAKTETFFFDLFAIFAQKSKFRKIRRRLSHSMRNNLTKKDMRAI